MTDLIARLREIPVWMVRDMAPGWQEHGTTAYEAADEISALRERVEALEGALLPCDVTVAPATVFRAGVKVSTLLDCIEDRRAALGTDIGGGRG